MNQPLSAARCFFHRKREAIGRCQGCSQHYCRECLVEVQGKLTCAQCMQVAVAAKPKKHLFLKVLSATTFLLGFVVMWWLFFALGRLLLTVPEAFHAGFFE